MGTRTSVFTRHASSCLVANVSFFGIYTSRTTPGTYASPRQRESGWTTPILALKHSRPPNLDQVDRRCILATPNLRKLISFLANPNSLKQNHSRMATPTAPKDVKEAIHLSAKVRRVDCIHGSNQKADCHLGLIRRDRRRPRPEPVPRRRNRNPNHYRPRQRDGRADHHQSRCSQGQQQRPISPGRHHQDLYRQDVPPLLRADCHHIPRRQQRPRERDRNRYQEY